MTTRSDVLLGKDTMDKCVTNSEKFRLIQRRRGFSRKELIRMGRWTDEMELEFRQNHDGFKPIKPEWIIGQGVKEA